MRSRVFVLTCVLTALAASIVHAQVQPRLIAWTGGPTPLGGDYRYFSIGEAGIDRAGRVSFVALATSPTRGSVQLVVRGRAEDLRALYREGDPIPSVPGGTFHNPSMSALPLTFANGLCLPTYYSIPGSIYGDLLLIMVEGDEFLVPVLGSNQHLGSTSSDPWTTGWAVRRYGGMHTSGLVAYLSGGVPTSSIGVVLGSPEGIRVAARNGVSLPSLSDGEVVQTIDSNDLVVNARGEAVFSITSTPPGGTQRGSLWKASVGNEASLLIRAGDPLPDDPDWRVTYILRSSSNAQGDVAVAVQGLRSSPNSGGAALLVGIPGSWTLVGATGRPAPGRMGLSDSPGTWLGVIGGTQSINPTAFHLLDDGRVLFWGVIRTGSTTSSGFWMGPPADVRLIALSGESPIGANDLPMQVAFFNRPMHVNARGDAILPANLLGISNAKIGHIAGGGNVMLRASGWPARATDGTLFTGLNDYVSTNDLGSTGSDGRLSKLSATSEYVVNVTGPSNLSGILVGRIACLADWNQDDGVTIDDLLSYLADYAQGSPDADVDDGNAIGRIDGGVTTDDLLYYLGRYEGGC